MVLADIKKVEQAMNNHFYIFLTPEIWIFFSEELTTLIFFCILNFIMASSYMCIKTYFFGIVDNGIDYTAQWVNPHKPGTHSHPLIYYYENY